MKRLSANVEYKLPSLAKYVDSVNFFHNNNPTDSQNLLFDATPEGVFELVFQNNDAVWQKSHQEVHWKRRDEAFVGGLHQQRYLLKLPPDTEIISVRFKPGAFKYVFSGALNEFANEKIPVVDLWQSAGKQLSQKLRRNQTPGEKIELIGGFIIDQLNDGRYSVIDETVRHIMNHRGLVDLPDLEQKSHLSSAQFRKRFREEVGLSPKKYSKIIRINSVISEFYSNQQGLLLDLAYAHDYYDQSHFIKEFKSIVGQTPTQYLAELSASC